jgi:ribonucleoside-diphosphate reductase alpha chain
MKKVVLFGRELPECGFCTSAKEALTAAGIEFEYRDIKDHPKDFADLMVTTVPQIIVDGVNLGGYDNIREIMKSIKNESSEVFVQKRSGKLAPLDISKIAKVLDWAAVGLDVSVSQVALNAHLQLFDGIKTSDIHDMVIKAAADLISVQSPDYQWFAARLLILHLRKKAYGTFNPPPLFDFVMHMTKIGKYDQHIVKDYDLREFAELERYIDHDRDMNFAYAGVKQMEGKYLVQDRVTGEIYESPQMLYMLVAMCLFSKYTGAERMQYVKDFYDATSTFKLSLPTPIMGGVRTPTRQFSSCVLIEADDSLDGINAAASTIVKYVSLRAGIGINAGMIRALGSPIRGGEATHTGCIPFFKHFLTAVKSCSQGGIRGGAATLFYPIWHLEAESLLVLKNNRGVEENRVRHLDYGVQFNKLMYTRLIKNGNITLFSPDAVEGMYDAFFADQELFEKLYIAAEKNPDIRKKVVKASELFSSFTQERASTGRIYIQNVDHCNTNSPFIASVAPIKQSNLCLEIALPTKPMKNSHDPDGEVALCTLAGFNLGLIDDLSELKPLANLIVRALDALLDYQDYPMPAAEQSTKNRRTLGVGIIGYATFLAKRGLKYSDGSANNATHEMMEAVQYYLLEASNNLAKEFGECPKFHETTYSQGIMPIDRYKKEIDACHTAELLLDWASLRDSIVKHGLRNSTLTALMPSETSSQIGNATNGIEPPRGYVSVKASKDGVFKQIVPYLDELKEAYELLWDIPSNKGYLEIVGIMQKFVDQAISANTNYDPQKFEGGKVPMKTILRDQMTAYKLGLKTLYYHNTRDGANDAQVDIVIETEDCEGGGCKL